ncbi:YdhK family protein [Fictibacillus nanhaiensis]|uniref:YdhK family protein n=1 Tax=Fictibacillus nanhaiensis TaxID=742169 RepID=UPI002E232A6E|nr:YdhK family protein [Fictibacillus nanhaiensis]
MTKNKLFVMLLLSFTLALTACGNDETTKKKEDSQGHADHGEMNHSGSGEVPEGLKKAETPTFKVGDKAVINADHMKGMNGAEATIAGAYDTTVYTVSYTPTTGGKKVNDHKWVIHEEIKNSGDKPLIPGTEVVLETDHMKGMKGAKATIDSAEQTTVYMVDYTPTTGGERIKNHKWVTESELSKDK